MINSSRKNLFNFILLYLIISGIFNGVISLFLSTAVKFCIDAFLLVVFVIFNLNLQLKINKTLVLFFSFYFFLTAFYLLFYVNTNSYGFAKLAKNVVLTCFYIIFYITLFVYSENQIIDKFKKYLLVLIVLLEIILFVYYVLYNKNNGLIKRSMIQVVIFQDWTGRFQGSFSEPSYLGMCLGTAALLVLLILKSNIKYLLSSLLIFILYYACQAKFAMLSLPIAFLLGIRYLKLPKLSYIYLYLILLLAFSYIAIFYEWFMDKLYFLISKIEENKESTGTYVTRASFLFISIKELFFFPVGTGMGLNFEYFRPGIKEAIVAATKHSLSTLEINGYLLNSDNFGSKETLSIIISSFGIVGLFFYIKYFLIHLGKRYKNQIICYVLIFFILLQSIFTSSIVSSVSIVFVLYARMVLNECSR